LPSIKKRWNPFRPSLEPLFFKINVGMPLQDFPVVHNKDRYTYVPFDKQFIKVLSTLVSANWAR